MSAEKMMHYIDSNFQKIQETHTLLNKIEERVKSFMKHESNPKIKASTDPNSQNKLTNTNQDQESHRLSILYEIQEMDQEYRQEIESLKKENSQLIENLNFLKRDSLKYRFQKEIAQLKDQNQVLREQNSCLLREIKLQAEKTPRWNKQSSERQSSEIKICTRNQRSLSTNVLPKDRQLTQPNNKKEERVILQIKQEVECERSKSEFLKKEIKDIKHKIEKQKDSLKTVQRQHANDENSFINGNSQIGLDVLEKTLKRIELAQEKQIQQNKYLMEILINSKQTMVSDGKKTVFRFCDYDPVILIDKITAQKDDESKSPYGKKQRNKKQQQK